MVVWAAFAVMTVVAVAMLLRPLLARRDVFADRDAHAAAVYRDQLDEISRDVERGVLSDAEAVGARTEIARRLLAVDASGKSGDTAKGATTPWTRIAVPLVVLAVPAIAVGSYLGTGKPELSAQPFAARQVEPVGGQNLSALVARVERHLQARPDDGDGWQVVGPAYMRLRRFADAVNAFERALALNGPSAEGAAALGEARVFAAGGMVDAGARSAFESALQLDAGMVEPRYYLGLAALQDGDRERAIALWQALVADAPPNANWAAEIEHQIAMARGDVDGGPATDDPVIEGPPIAGSGSAPRLDQETIEAAGAMSDVDRKTMIEGMVAGLDQRLADDGGSVEDWVRLIRAYMVLGRKDDALAALERARTGLESDPAATSRLTESVRSMGIDS